MNRAVEDAKLQLGSGKKKGTLAFPIELNVPVQVFEKRVEADVHNEDSVLSRRAILLCY
jgi:hypothetical protein